MSAYIVPAFLLIAAMGAAFATILIPISAVHGWRNKASGFMHLIPYGIIFTSALLVAFANRDLSMMLDSAETAKPALVAWSQRLFTLVMLVACGERLASYTLGTRARHAHGPLALAFGLYWLCTALLPMFTGQYSSWSHEIAYPLLMGLAALTLGSTEATRLVEATRNSIVLFALASWAMVLVAPHMVLESNYSQGYLPGVPRFAGLAAHAVALGMLMQIGVFCLWAQPFERKAMNLLGLTALLAALFLSQAKAAWVSTLLCSLVMLHSRSDGQFLRRFFGSTSPVLGPVLMIFLVFFAAAGLILLGIQGQYADFLASEEGAQLTSLTGRDAIWLVALEEWQRYPMFGFGNELFSAQHRLSLGMSSATHAHNQLLHTLASSGLVGAIAFVGYLATLGYYAAKSRLQSGGLSAVLYLALLVRGVGEIPFTLSGYGHEFLTHFLLLAITSVNLKNQQIYLKQNYRRHLDKSVQFSKKLRN